MIGHRQIERARAAGWKPQFVDFRIGFPLPQPHLPPLENRLESEMVPDIYTESDDPQLADLRFLSGVRIHLICKPETPWVVYSAWTDAITAAGGEIWAAKEPDGEIQLFKFWLEARRGG